MFDNVDTYMTSFYLNKHVNYEKHLQIGHIWYIFMDYIYIGASFISSYCLSTEENIVIS